MCADDTKYERSVNEIFQRDPDKVQKWSDKWLEKFNLEKMHVMKMGKGINRLHCDYHIGGNKSYNRAVEGT